MATSNNSSNSFDFSLGNKWMRVFWLIVAGFAGMVLFKCWGEPILDFLDIAKTDMAKTDDNASGYPANARGYFVLPILSIVVFFALWVFRTYDTRQQIEQANRQLKQASQQANRQLQQANFAKGLDNLVSDDPLQVDIGVILLLEVSKATSAFDKEIRLAFIKRLKELPGNLEGRTVMEMRANRLSYAQYIIQWLIEHPKKDGDPFDLRGMDCRYQEFTSRRLSGGVNKKLEIAEILTSSSGQPNDVNPIPDITFEEAFCKNISFKGVNVSKYDFTNAEKVNITGAYINPLIIHGLTPDRILQINFDPQTYKVAKHPDWPDPKPLTDKSIQVRQKGKTDSPE